MTIFTRCDGCSKEETRGRGYTFKATEFKIDGKTIWSADLCAICIKRISKPHDWIRSTYRNTA